MFVGLNVHNNQYGLNAYQAQCEQMGVYLLRDAMPKPGDAAWQRILDAMAAGFAFNLWCADTNVAACAANINSMPVSTGPGSGGFRAMNATNYKYCDCVGTGDKVGARYQVELWKHWGRD